MIPLLLSLVISEAGWIAIGGAVISVATTIAGVAVLFIKEHFSILRAREQRAIDELAQVKRDSELAKLTALQAESVKAAGAEREVRLAKKSDELLTAVSGVKKDVLDNTEYTRTAVTTANGYNDKILAAQEAARKAQENILELTRLQTESRILNTKPVDVNVINDTDHAVPVTQ